MRQSQLFTKTRKEAPKDEVSKNAALLIRAGFIHKDIAGVYSYLPLGLRVLNKIITIIREEMNAIGGQELFLSSLQDPKPWEASGRWNDEVVDIWFKTKLKNGGELGLANTHEEVLTGLMTNHIASYKDLPKYVYQFQTKFRNETRAKSGILRTREFIMKDLYSFSKSEKEFREFYEICAEAYLKIFTRVGIGDITYRTFASGGSFSKFSDEFQTECNAGEDIIYIDDKKKIAVNKEVNTPELLKELDLSASELREAKAIEVGNIFPLGSKYSSALNLVYKNEEGKNESVYMGSYGIGPGRVMGTVVEALSDESGLVWPKEIAPYEIHLIPVFDKEGKAQNYAEKLYKNLVDKGVEVLYDDRDIRAGEKFGDSDLFGIPTRITISEKTIAEDVLEVKNRKTGKVEKVPLNEFLKSL